MCHLPRTPRRLTDRRDRVWGVPRGSWPSRAAVRRDASQGEGGAKSGAIGDDDNAARRPPATVRQTSVEQAEDPRDTPWDLAALATHWRPSQGPYCARA